ncbi:MAG: methylmalonyl-CoA mutase family protein [Elusimicrobiota bacterium]
MRASKRHTESRSFPANPERFVTPSGIEMLRFYGPGAEGAAGRDTRDPAFAGVKLGSAGEPPFTRGIQKTMYRGRLWTMRQYAGFGTASETNERFRFLLEQGQTGLSTAFDLPTQLGYDADHPQARGEVGRVGVHVGTIEDMEALFDGIPLDRVSTSMTINATAPVLLALYAALAKRQGVALGRLRGTIQNDILKEYVARGTYVYPVEHGLRLAVDTIEHCARHLPKWYPVSISGYHIREAGADAVQELAFTFGNAEAYIRALLDRGLSIDDFGPRLAFFFGCHNHFLEEISKFRAARRVWHRMMAEDYGAKDPKTMKLRFHVQTCGSTLTSRQPLNNVTRVALQAMAAVLGGCQSLHTNSYDEALALPSEDSARVALRTQQILAFETGVPNTVDPVAGAYAVETLTDELEERVWKTLRRIRSLGGMLPAIAKGVPQEEIREAAYRHQRDVESGRRKVVGVNCYEAEGGDGNGGRARSRAAEKVLKVSPKLESEQRKRLAAFKKGRGRGGAKAALKELKAAAGSPKENLFDRILACVEARATLGEICDTLRDVFGEYHGA